MYTCLPVYTEHGHFLRFFLTAKLDFIHSIIHFWVSKHAYFKVVFDEESHFCNVTVASEVLKIAAKVEKGSFYP